MNVGNKVKLRKLTVALINVVIENDYLYEQEIPLGLASIGAFLRKNGYKVIFKQCIANNGKEQFTSVVMAEADIYGFQLNMVNFHLVKSLVEKIKSKNPEAITIFGGPYLVSLSEDIIRREPLFDFIVVGEGEFTTIELLQAIEKQEKEFSHIKGLVWRNSSKQIIKNELRDLIEDLDSLPFAARDFLDEAKCDPKDKNLLVTIRIITSRGCIGTCNFCCVNLYKKIQKGDAWRGRSPKNVVDELQMLNHKYKARVFNFSDSSFEDPGKLGKIRTRQICEEIIRRGLKISFKIYLRCETMKSQEDIELLRLYKQAGVDVVIIGVESTTEYELRFYEKHASVEDNYRTARILREIDLFYILIGLLMFGPNSTMETVRKNAEFVYKYGFADNIMPLSNVLMLFRDSKLYKILKAENRVVESAGHYDVPLYIMKDPLVKRLSQHWQDPFARFPNIWEVNKLQIDMGNLVSRMNNPMNGKVLNSLKDNFIDFKKSYKGVSEEFGKLQYDYFLYTMDLIAADCSDSKLSSTAVDFFVKTYEKYLPKYRNLYNTFLKRIIEEGFSLSGLVFDHVLSAMMKDEVERVAERGRLQKTVVDKV